MPRRVSEIRRSQNKKLIQSEEVQDLFNKSVESVFSDDNKDIKDLYKPIPQDKITPLKGEQPTSTVTEKVGDVKEKEVELCQEPDFLISDDVVKALQQKRYSDINKPKHHELAEKKTLKQRLFSIFRG